MTHQRLIDKLQIEKSISIDDFILLFDESLDKDSIILILKYLAQLDDFYESFIKLNLKQLILLIRYASIFRLPKLMEACSIKIITYMNYNNLNNLTTNEIEILYSIDRNIFQSIIKEISSKYANTIDKVQHKEIISNILKLPKIISQDILENILIK